MLVRRSARFVVSLLVVTAVTTAGCALPGRAPEFRGWLTNGAAAVAPSRPIIPSENGTASLVRDPASNALSVSIGPPTGSGAESSTVAGTTKILLYFKTSQPQSGTLVGIHLPLLASHHLTLDKSWLDAEKSQIVLALSADQLGLDLIATALFSPAGLQGVADLGAGGIVLLDGRAARPEFPYGSVWTVDEDGTEFVLVQSYVEYPVWLYELELAGSNGRATVPIRRVLSPHKTIRIRARHGLGSATPTSVRAAILQTVPTAFWQRYRLSKGE